MTRKFRELRERMTPERQERIRKRTEELLAELEELQEKGEAAQGLTEVEPM